MITLLSTTPNCDFRDRGSFDSEEEAMSYARYLANLNSTYTYDKVEFFLKFGPKERPIKIHDGELFHRERRRKHVSR